jgi:tetratricopeptide (TPR) repeat protein
MFYCWRPLIRRRIGLRTFVVINGKAAVVVVGLGALTWKQTQVWHDSDRLWKYAISAGPESNIAHYNLGIVMSKRGELGEAIKHYREALRIKPNSIEANFNLGNAMVNRGELEEAIKRFRQVLRINPAYAEAHNNLGVAIFKGGKITEATEHFCQSLRLGYALAQPNLKRALARSGEREDSVKSCREP